MVVRKKTIRKNPKKVLKRSGKSKKSCKGGKKMGCKKKPLNPFFKMMLSAKKNNKPFFMYKNKKYVGRKHDKLGMIYKKE